jgi:hypothetical protein
LLLGKCYMEIKRANQEGNPNLALQTMCSRDAAYLINPCKVCGSQRSVLPDLKGLRE